MDPARNGSSTWSYASYCGQMGTAGRCLPKENQREISKNFRCRRGNFLVDHSTNHWPVRLGSSLAMAGGLALRAGAIRNFLPLPHVYPACPVEPFVLLNRGEIRLGRLFHWGSSGGSFIMVMLFLLAPDSSPLNPQSAIPNPQSQPLTTRP